MGPSRVAHSDEKGTPDCELIVDGGKTINPHFRVIFLSQLLHWNALG